MLLCVGFPSKPPNVMMGVRQAKYKNIQLAKHWLAMASVKSDQYHGAFRLMSLIKPPNSLPVLVRPDSSLNFSSSSSSLCSSLGASGRFRGSYTIGQKKIKLVLMPNY